jgi:fatty-acyl-CoA synthase
MILPPSQRRKLLEARYPAWRPMTISQALDAATAEFADRPLFITDQRSYRYADMQAWSRRLASGLIASGVQKGDHVAIVLANYPEYVAMKFAIARAGAVAVPINYLLREQELRYVLEQSDTTVLVTMNALRDRDYLADLDVIAPGWETRGGGQQLPRLRSVFVLSTDGQRRPGITDLEDLASLATTESNAELAKREVTGDPDFRSDVIYTSGTTGRPKGVMLSHDMILRAAYASVYTRALEDGRRILFSLPMYHVFGYVECMIASIFVGGAIIPHVMFDAEQMIIAAERHRAGEMVCVPMMTLKLLEVVRQRGFDRSHLIAMFNSGGASPPTIWQEIRELLGAREILTGYGMTETTASTTCTVPEGPDDKLLTTNGRLKQAGVAGDPALGGVLALYKTIDPESGADLPTGTPGELVAKGPIITRGYYKKPEETRAAFNADGWLHTGDVGTIDADGYLTLTGRIKETYRCGGEMVMPREIEELITEHPLVGQAFVVGIADKKMGEVGCVCVVPAGDQRPSGEELIELCTRRLARFKVPRYVIFLAAHDIPYTATGRAQKFRLADIARQQLVASGVIAATETAS